MEFAFGAARWVVGRALSPVTDGLLESWAASSELGPNVRALKLQLLYAQGMLNNARGREVRNPALGHLLQELRHHAYNADDVLDELEYFRIQDELEGTYETTDDDRGLVGGLVLHARHAATAVASKLKIPSCSCAAVCHHNTKPKLKFDRVEMSKRMAEIVEQLKPVCAMVATILDIELSGLIASNSTTSLQGTALDHQLTRNTTPEIIQHQLYGRDALKKEVVDGITHGKYTTNDLTVLSIVGPGGLGKTTFTQHIFQAVKSHFQVTIWICVSQNKFNASRLAQEIVKQIPENADSVKQNAGDEERIEKNLHSKKFLLVLDDIWTCHEDEWTKLLARFSKGGTKGNTVIVTTRIPKVAQMVTTPDCRIKLERLNDEDCMSFFKACVFDDKKQWSEHGNLHSVGSEIVKKLKGFPLAVKTVGRLLKNDLSVDHWRTVLESREWEHQTSDNDIMPALKLSYNYLPFHLQQCFSHCALFPEDYKFDSQELIHLWIGLGFLLDNDHNKRIEDIGSYYLNELVSHGFFDKDKNKDDDHTYYVIHDLLHDLAVNVSAYECLSIQVSKARSTQIPASIRHMSIIVENTDVQDRITFGNYKRDLDTLGQRLKAGNLRTLMLFGDDHGSFCIPFQDIFREAKALRVIFISGASYDVEDVLQNFSRLVHLRYIRITGEIFNEKSLSSTISRFYNLLVLDVKECKGFSSTREMSNLVKIRHFVVGDDKCHSEIYEVGKLESIQELRRFEVKREKHGFELNQLGKLLQFRGSLGIYNLERIEAVTEVDEANLVQMHHLNGLVLEWGTSQSERNIKREEDVLERIKLPNNPQELCISGHGGGTYPTWLGAEHFVENLECLRLKSVAWNSLPPLGELLMVGEERPRIAGKIFSNLKELELVNIPSLKKWCASSPFSHLEELTVVDCSELTQLPFTDYTCPQAQEKNINTFPKLQSISISNCAKLECVPQIPWSSSLSDATLSDVGTSIQYICYKKNTQCIDVTFREDALDRELGNVLVLGNLREIEEFEIRGCHTVPLRHLQMLVSLKTLRIYDCSNLLWATEGESSDQFQFPVEFLVIIRCGATIDELAQLISYFPNLSRLELWDCGKQTGVEETEAAAGGMLPLPLQLKDLSIIGCPDVRLCSRSLQNQTSLRSICISSCPKILSSNRCSSSYCPFPTSLRELHLCGAEIDDMCTLTPLSNLTVLDLMNCEGLRSKDIWYLLAQGHLEQLETDGLPNLFDISEASRIMPVLEADGESRNPAAPIRGHFSSSLTELRFQNPDMVHFTTEQSEALQLLASLQHLQIAFCKSLQSLPAGLSGLRNLKKLEVVCCDSIRSLPKGGLPSSLIILEISGCPAIRSLGTLPSSLNLLEILSSPAIQSLPKGTLPKSLEELTIYNCSSIRPLPKGCLPSSLKKLDVRHSNDKLRRQCRKLKGTIPIVLTD